MVTHITPARSAVCLGLFLSLAFHSQTLFSSPKSPPAPSQVKSWCVAAEQYKQNGEDPKAITEFLKVIHDNKLPKGADVSCAKDGLNLLVKKQCDNAKNFMDSSRFNEAIANYDSIRNNLSEVVDISCALNGIKQAKLLHCEDEVISGLKIGTVAQELYTKLISDNASKENSSEENIACVTNGLKKFKGAQDKKINVLNTLVEFGFGDIATDLLKTYLKDDPTFLEADQVFDKKKSQYLLNTLRPGGSIWTAINKTRVDTFLQFFPKVPSLIMEMSIVEAFVWIFLIWLAGRKFWWGSPALSIGSFSPSDKKTDHTIYFAADLQHQLIDLTSTESPSHNVFMVTGFIDESSAPSIGKALPVPAQLLESLTLLLPKLFARRSLEVTGLIHTAPKKGNEVEVTIDGVIIQIASGKRILAKHALFAKDFDCSDSNYADHLALCAAAWIIFMLQQKPVQWYAILKSFFKRICKNPPTKILGTSDWEAYAWFALGNKYDQANKLKKAEAAYLKSLSIDPLFLASRVNLAGIYSLLADTIGATQNCDQTEIKKLQHLAIQQLNAVEREEKNEGFKPDDAICYTWLFSRAMINFERYQNAEDWADRSKDAEKLEDWTDPSKDAEKLVERISKRPRLLWFFNPRLNEYLNWRYPVAECMRLGLQAVFSHMTDETGLENITKELAVRMDFYSLYNLACTYALFANYFKNQDKRDKLENECFNFLEKSLDILKTEKSLDARTFKYYRALTRAKNDHSFKALSTDPRFLTLVTKTRRRNVTPPPIKTQKNLDRF